MTIINVGYGDDDNNNNAVDIATCHINNKKSQEHIFLMY